MKENPQEQLAYYRETGQVELAKEYEQYLRETGQLKAEPMPKVPAAASDASRVAPRADGGGDLESLLAGGQGKVLKDEIVPGLGALAITAAQGIPFMRNAQAGALAATSPMNYRESLKSLDDLTSEIPGDMRAGIQIATGALPWTKAAGVAAPLVTRTAKAAGAFSKELPFVKNIVRGTEKARQAWTASKPIEKVAEKAPKSLDEILGGMEVLPEAEVAAPKAQTIEEVIEQTAGKPWKPRSAPKARFDWFAEQMAKRKASGQIADLSLEDLLQESLGHVQKGGSLKSAADALKIVRHP